MSNKEKFLKLVSEDDADTLGWAKGKSNMHRIDQIIIEAGIRSWQIFRIENPAFSDRLRKAMEQSYVSGRKYGAETANERYDKELSRLNELVKAQKELIAIYEKAITLGEPDVWELYSQIQKLDK